MADRGGMLSVAEAERAVLASRLFDERWYAAQTGRRFADRGAAVSDWVTAAPADASPHPLFEPRWLYPGGRWRRSAPDPLSYWLSRPGARGRSPHPCYPQAELGPLDHWLADHDPGELLRPPLPRDPVATTVVEVPADDLLAAVAWLRHLARGGSGRAAAEVTGVVVTDDPARVRILTAALAALPSVRVAPDVPQATGEPGSGPGQGVHVGVDPGVAPPAWPWLPDLLDRLSASPAAGGAQALLLRDDHTVASPLLVGCPVDDAVRLDGTALPEAVQPGVVARPVPPRPGPVVLAAHSRLPGPDDTRPRGEAWARWWTGAGYAAPGTPLRVREGRPALRWSIEISAGVGPWGRRWGDWHFARSLADALERRGQWVAVDHPETRGRASRERDDVVLVLRGLYPGRLEPHAVNLLWVISHPATVERGELEGYDAAWAASAPWAERHGVLHLPQCTDATRFHPGVAGVTVATVVTEPTDGTELLFVGNAHGRRRPVVDAAVAAGLPVTVIGAGWEERAAGVTWEAEALANADLPARYARAAVVLGDHHDDMRTEGFVANRVFDTLAVGARLVVDDVAGLADVLGPDLAAAVGIWTGPADLARLATPPYAALPDGPRRAELAARVVAEHSFDARAATLLEAALRLRGRAADPAARPGSPR